MKELRTRRERARFLYSELASQQNDMPNLVLWVEEDPKILWEPVQAGNTLMHVASRCMRREQLYGSSTVTSNRIHSCRDDRWKWIVQKACCEYEHFLTKKDKGGETCIDCFLTAWTSGSRVGSITNASNFCVIVEKLLQSKRSMDTLRYVVTSQSQSSSDGSVSMASSLEARPTDVILVARVLKALHVLCHAAERGFVVEPTEPSTHNDFSLIAFLARTGKCPEIVVRLLVALFSHQTRQRDAQGCLPLHSWAMGNSATKTGITAFSEDDQAQGLISALSSACPEAATIPAPNGQLALHLALRYFKPLRHVEVLWQCAPQTLGRVDPVSGLYPFAMASLAARVELRHRVRGMHRRGPSVRLFDWLDATRDMDCTEGEIASYLLGSVYEMLRAYPQALQDSCPLGVNDTEEE